MNQSIYHCLNSVHSGLMELKYFDQILAAGDLDGAADRLVDLWNKLFNPTQILTELYCGEFWNDWIGRDAFEENLKEVYLLLNNEDEPDTSLSTLEEVRNCLFANFCLLTEAFRHLAADVGEDGLRNMIYTKVG